MNDCDRRSFLASCLAGILVGGAGVHLRVSLADEPSAESLLALLAPVFDGSSVSALGHAYLDAHPVELDSRRLVASLGGGVGRDASSTRAVIDRLAAAIRHDFESGDVVGVDGWMLARTEARLYALFALRAG